MALANLEILIWNLQCHDALLPAKTCLKSLSKDDGMDLYDWVSTWHGWRLKHRDQLQEASWKLESGPLGIDPS